MEIFNRKAVAERDDAALPHEDVYRVMSADSQAEDDGNDTPNGGR
jgi:hypothetical protein